MNTHVVTLAKPFFEVCFMLTFDYMFQNDVHNAVLWSVMLYCSVLHTSIVHN